MTESSTSNAVSVGQISGVIPEHQHHHHQHHSAYALDRDNNDGDASASSRRRSSIKIHSPPDTLAFGQHPPPIVASSSKSPQRRESISKSTANPRYHLDESSFTPPPSRTRQELPSSSTAVPSQGPSSWNRNSTSDAPLPSRPDMLRFMSGLSASSAHLRGPLTPSDRGYGEHKGHPFNAKRPEMISRDSQSSFSSRTGNSPNPFHLELTTKGRKRKRLAKACSACHKNKRRCDGFAPCSNWYVERTPYVEYNPRNLTSFLLRLHSEFSSRVCSYLNAAGEAIPPPRTRDAMQVDKSESPDDKKPTDDDTNRPDMADPLLAPHGSAQAPRRSIDLTWAVERESQRVYDMLQDARRASDKEAADDRASWLDARDLEVAEAIALERSQNGHINPFHNGLGVDLNGDDSRGHTTSSGLPNNSSKSYHASGSVGSSGNSNFSRDSSSGQPPHGAGRGGPPDGLPRRSEESNRRRDRDEEWYLSVVERIDADDILVEEMCHQFFARVHPYQLMFHQPTFAYRRYLDRVPSALLHIIYAFAVRFMHHSIFVPPSISESNAHFPAHARGEVLASRAKQEANAWLRASGIAKGDDLMEGINKRRNDPAYKLTWTDTEMIQAICLIGLYEQSMGRPHKSVQYLGEWDQVFWLISFRSYN